MQLRFMAQDTRATIISGRSLHEAAVVGFGGCDRSRGDGPSRGARSSARRRRSCCDLCTAEGRAFCSASIRTGLGRRGFVVGSEGFGDWMSVQPQWWLSGHPRSGATVQLATFQYTRQLIRQPRSDADSIPQTVKGRSRRTAAAMMRRMIGEDDGAAATPDARTVGTVPGPRDG